MPPVAPRAGAEQRGRLAPVLTQRVERRVQQQYAQRDLEIGVKHDQPGFGVKIKALHQAVLAQQQRQAAVQPQQDDKGEGQRHPGKVAGHIGKRHHKIVEPRLAQLTQRVTADQGNQQPVNARPEGNLQRELKRLQIERRGQDVNVIAQPPTAGLAEKTADRNPHQRRDLKRAEQHNKRQQAQRGNPLSFHVHPYANSARQRGLSCATCSTSHSVPHRSVCCGLASFWLKAAPNTNSGTCRSSGNTPPWLRSSFMP
ncbi:hypothetical protein D3C81_322740 [compost metagenome]